MFSQLPEKYCLRDKMSHEVFLSLGSNLGLCSNNLQNAIAAITEHEGLKMVRGSGIYETQPQDIAGQPWFCNQVILLDVRKFWTPWSLLALLKDIEIRMGRTRTKCKGPRIIDLDILTYGNMIIDRDGLQIPHASMKKRAFVVVPMMDICPEYIFPNGESLRNVSDKLEFRLEQNRIYQNQ